MAWKESQIVTIVKQNFSIINETLIKIKYFNHLSIRSFRQCIRMYIVAARWRHTKNDRKQSLSEYIQTSSHLCLLYSEKKKCRHHIYSRILYVIIARQFGNRLFILHAINSNNRNKRDRLFYSCVQFFFFSVDLNVQRKCHERVIKDNRNLSNNHINLITCKTNRYRFNFKTIFHTFFYVLFFVQVASTKILKMLTINVMDALNDYLFFGRCRLAIDIFTLNVRL